MSEQPTTERQSMLDNIAPKLSEADLARILDLLSRHDRNRISKHILRLEIEAKGAAPEPEDDELPDQSAMLAQPPLEYVLQRKSDRFDCCHFPAHAWNLVIVPQPLTKAEKPARICPNCDAELPKGCAGIFAESDGQSCALNWSPLNGAGKP